MKVSVITATYNSARDILSALTSLQAQTYRDIEWIIVDGASKDHTLSIIRDNYKGDLRIISERDAGIYDALNKGIGMARGEVIGFLHSDDFLASPDILQEVVSCLEGQEFDGVYGDLQYIYRNEITKVVRHWKSAAFKPYLLGRGWMPAHPTLFLKKEVYQKHGGFDLEYKIAADYDFMLRIFGDPLLKFHYLPQVFTKMRVGGASNKSLRNIRLKSSEDLRALKSNGIRFPYKALAHKNLSKIGQFYTR